MTLEEHIKRYDNRAKSIRNAIVEKKESQEVVELLKELKAYKNKDMRLIYANPLGEAIRCAMCTNPIKSDRGCDGGCKVDEQMYKKVMEAVNELIEEVNADEDSD